MRTLLFPLLLGLAVSAGAQDRASVDKFTQAMNAAGQANDVHWFLSHMEPTMIYRGTDGMHFTKEYADYVATVDKAPRKDAPKPDDTSKLTLGAVDIRGERAIVDVTSSWTDKGGAKKSHTQPMHFVLVWRDGDWHFWRVDVGAVS